MSRHAITRASTAPCAPIGGVPARARLVQRKCACGGSAGLAGECEECAKKRTVMRRAAGSAPMLMAPPVVHDVLAAPGEPLDAATRAFFEPRFGHDFSRVRVHADARAAASARAVDAMAYTVGRHIVFGAGRFSPGTAGGRHLLAHELGHAVQQDGADERRPAELVIGAPHSTFEQEADAAAERVASGAPAVVQRGVGSVLMRRLLVERPAQLIPNPGGTGLVQTNAATIQTYLRQLSPQGQPTVDATSGEVTMAQQFCAHRGFWTRLGRGIASGAATGARIGLYGLIVGAIPGAILGGLIGGIAGIFGPDSEAEESNTPSGSTCICDMIASRRDWKIEIDDSDTPATGTGLVRVNSPNSPRTWGAATVSGRLPNMDHWLTLGHELCGHAWLEDQGQDEGEEPGERHHRTVERENRIRAEHGLEARGFRLRDPYCGESFSRAHGVSTGPPQWQRQYDPRSQQFMRGDPRLQGRADDTMLDNCRAMREQYLPEEARRYRVDERIP